MVKISASILSADFANLQKELESLETAKADMVHIDVMDGNFVPNLTIGPQVIKALRIHSKLPFDVHLMIERPEYSVKSYIDAGANLVTIHPETCKHLDRTLDMIKEFGAKAGLALLPSTSPDIIDYIIDKIDLLLIMTVNPGFSNQPFINNQLAKISIIAEKIRLAKEPIMLAVDGGINPDTAKQCVEAGANVLVSGSFIFDNKSGNKSNLISQLRGM